FGEPFGPITLIDIASDDLLRRDRLQRCQHLRLADFPGMEDPLATFQHVQRLGPQQAEVIRRHADEHEDAMDPYESCGSCELTEVGRKGRQQKARTGRAFCDFRMVSTPLERNEWCPGTESNRRHGDFQSPALPTELPGQRGAIRRIWLLAV